jgi:hypothetical protein
MAASPYRRAIVAEQKKKGGKGGKGNWRERMRPPKDIAIPMLLIAGDYKDEAAKYDNSLATYDAAGHQIEIVLPYYKYGKHIRKMPGSGQRERISDIVCSRGPNPHQPMNCLGCWHMDNGDKSLKLSDSFAVGFVHLGLYHGHPIINRENNTWVVKGEGQNKGELFISYDECVGRTCNFCRVLRGEQPILTAGESFIFPRETITTVFGHRRYLDIGKNGLGDILGWDLSISSMCFGPGYARHANGQLIYDAQNQAIPNGQICGNQLTALSYNCVNCNSVIIDMARDTRNDAQIQQAAIEQHPCLTCQRQVDIKEVVSCDLCGQPKQVNVFSGEAVVWVKRQGEGTGSHMVLERFESLDAFLANPNNMPPQLVPQGTTAKEMIINMAKPYDFEELLKPQDLAQQAKRLELPIPPGMGGQSTAGQYGQPPPPPPQYPGQQQQQYVPPAAPGGAPPQFGAPPQGYGAPPAPPAQPQAGVQFAPPPSRPNYSQ